jgi:hypothetical protein
MLKSRIRFIAIIAFLIPIAMSAVTCTFSDNIQMAVTINGLEKGDEAVLSISFETTTTDEAPLLEKNVTGEGEAITVELDASLEDGYYQLLLEAPPKYFRDPKGYFFQVYQSEIVNLTGQSIVFNLIPQEETPSMLEAMVSLSAPRKQLAPRKPLVSGSLSGLLNSDDLAIVHIYTVTGQEKNYCAREGNGPWEGVIPNPEESEYYTITAEAEGYTVEPESYKILVKDEEDETGYVVEDGEVGEEALHLGFHFSAE